MKSDKEIKKEFKLKASKDPDMYYATKVLKYAGFMRKQCSCGIYFWTVNVSQDVCGDSSCSGGFRFFEDNPAKQKLSYIDVWNNFSAMFKELGYTPIKRYPTVARWRDDMDFTIASIAGFQPYVVSGEVEPPAKRLVIPQFCLRFGDIDNVGITGSHLTCFNMIGQHMFVQPSEWDQDKVFFDIKKWLNEGLGLSDNEITFHEDAWSGGGNFGPCMEFFSRGVEIGNQVYMLYEQTEDGSKELSLKVLDMGMGMERNAWFSQGCPTIYDATFPFVMNKLRDRTKIKVNDGLIKKYVPYAGFLNIDEVDDINKAWETVSSKVGVSAQKLKNEIMPNAALYSIAEHARGLLIALSDGALPSNVGGGYNLRVLARRAFSFIDKYGWDIDLADVCAWHAQELQDIFPELEGHLADVKKIINVERQKYENTKERGRNLVTKLIEKGNISEEVLLENYDSNGIPPEVIKSEAEKQGITVIVPDDFYMKVSQRHLKREQVHSTKKKETVEIPQGIVETKALYFDDFEVVEFEGQVEYVGDKFIILDKTIFYPTSGGQLHDIGNINGHEVYNVAKQGPYILHYIKDADKFKVGQTVFGEIDYKRRKTLAVHHSATHVINAAAKQILGSHIYQAGAKKTLEKAHLDITHFESLDETEIKNIEDYANDIVKRDIEIKSMFMLRTEAENTFGMSIYQGGAVPGKILRIINIENVDVEACGGTHLHRTLEIGTIRILKSSKISDSIVRIEFVAGDVANLLDKAAGDIVGSISEMLGCNENQIPARAEELFVKWKAAKKALNKKKEDIDINEFDLISDETFDGDVLAETAKILKTQPEHVPKTIQRFMMELDEIRGKLK